MVETLNVSGMMVNRRMARAVADPETHGFLTRLECECLWYGGEYMKADRRFASSRICARCSCKKNDPMLFKGAWRCGGCDVLKDRDAIAAGHLEGRLGLSLPVSGCGERV